MAIADTGERQTSAWVTSAGIAAVAIGSGSSPLLSSEPNDLSGPSVFGLLLAVVAVLVFAIRAVLKRTIRSVLPVLPVLVAGAIVIGVASLSESLHWRWSRGDFQAIVDGERVENCSTLHPCTVGWWSAEGVDLDSGLPTVWIAGGPCYAGHGFAHLAPNTSIQDAQKIADARDGSRGHVSVRAWRDDWAWICITT